MKKNSKGQSQEPAETIGVDLNKSGTNKSGDNKSGDRLSFHLIIAREKRQIGDSHG